MLVAIGAVDVFDSSSFSFSNNSSRSLSIDVDVILRDPLSSFDSGSKKPTDRRADVLDTCGRLDI